MTFETQIDNLQELVVDGVFNGVLTEVPILPADAQLKVVEVQRGSPPSLALDLDALEPGEKYVARVSATNAAGYGPTTTADAAEGGDRGSNNDGLGVVPFGVVARAAPQAPRISGISAVSASQLEVTLEPPTDDPGFDVHGYKVRDTGYHQRSVCIVLARAIATVHILGHHRFTISVDILNYGVFPYLVYTPNMTDICPKLETVMPKPFM